MDESEVTGLRVGVVGAGPIGLHTAAELRARGADVTVLNAGPLTHPHVVGVGPVAAGLVEPVATSEEDAELVGKLCQESLPVWMTIDPRLGVDRRDVRFHPGSSGAPGWVAGMPSARQLPDGDWTFRSAVVTPKIWLPEKVRNLRAAGVRLCRRRVDDLAELTQEFQIVVNASGPGAWALGDREMFGSRAVLVWSRAEVSEVRFDDDRFLYGIPQRQYVAFGGTNVPVYGDPTSWDRQPTDSEVHRLLAGAHDLYPELKRIDVAAVTCNYRPCRPRIRMEVESFGAGLILHLAGFGGSGWTLAPGAARVGTRMVESALADGVSSVRIA